MFFRSRGKITDVETWQRGTTKDITYCLTDATDWNQTKPVCDSALEWTVWPSGRSDSKHRDREIGRPNNLGAQIWQMMRSNNTKSENLEKDFPEILERAHQLEWNETAKAIKSLGPEGR